MNLMKADWSSWYSRAGQDGVAWLVWLLKTGWSSWLNQVDLAGLVGVAWLV
jgi:hypothetical protein